MTRSIQGRLLLGTVVAAVLVLSIAGGIVYMLVRAALRAEFDTGLESKARALAALVEQDEGQIEFELGHDVLPEFARPARPEYFQLWGATGEILQRSASLDTADLPRMGGAAGQPVFMDLTLPDGRAGRLVALSFEPRGGGEDEARLHAGTGDLGVVTIAVARDTLGLDALLVRLRWLLLGVGCGAVALASVVLLVVVRSGLRPLRTLAGRIAEIGARDLSAELVLPNAPTELRPVVQRLNEMLRRLGESFARERTLTADVAHELRTPLAGLRATLEVAATRTRTGEEYRMLLADALAVAVQLQALTENLLALARLEAGQVELKLERFELEAALRECWTPLAWRADERKLDVRWRVASGTHVAADRGKLRQIATNLLDNAVTYADTGGRMQVFAAAQDGAVVLEVANSGSRLTAGQVGHVFDRFWRGDAARGATGVHCGLGLALVKRLVEAHGGTIEARVSLDGTFHVTLSLPGPASSARNQGVSH